MFCPNCGIELSISDQRFCRNCGIELPSIIKSTNQNKSENLLPKTNPKQYCSTSYLFDNNRDYYIFKEDSLHGGDGYIMDEKGQIVGKIERIVTNAGDLIKLRENNNKLSSIIYRKPNSINDTQEIKDAQGNLVAQIKKETPPHENPKFILLDSNGNKWFEAQGDYLGRSYKIKDIYSEKIVAEVQRADTWEEIILDKPSDYKEIYALKIFDSLTDRCILLGYVISIDIALRDQHILKDIEFHTTGIDDHLNSD